jgi:hypothetical protein
MNYIKPINKFLSEAISLKMYKENLPKKFRYKKSPAYNKWTKVFGKDVNRISISLNSSPIKLPSSTFLMEEINYILAPLGYKINSFEDYLNNKVYKIGDTKNPMKIGSLLSKNNQSLFQKYDTSLERKDWKDKIENYNKDLKIIISRHPYDILGMSSGREWRGDSCMRLGSRQNDKVYYDIVCSLKTKYNDVNTTKKGEYEYGWVESEGSRKDSIQADVTQGTLVAYVVNVNDNNINNPISRLLIKPYFNKRDKKDIIWVSSDSLYGEEVEGFKESVDSWIKSWQGDVLNGLYMIKDGLYSDGKTNVRVNKPVEEWTNVDIDNFLDDVVLRYDASDKPWTINENGVVDVDGDVQVFGGEILKLDKLPIKFGKVTGDFQCKNVDLTTLENCPDYVGGKFEVNSNYLTTLDFFPKNVGRNINLSNNKLTSLVGLPEKVNGNLEIFRNSLVNLEGCSKIIDGSFDVQSNKLTTLKGFPEKINGSVNINNNNLYNIGVDLSDYVFDNFYCNNSDITSLVGFPKKIKYNFECSKNQLTDLQGFPLEVGFSIDLSKNFLRSLEGLPKVVKYDLYVYENYLNSKTTGFPEKVNGSLSIQDQKGGYEFDEKEILKVCDVKVHIYT